ncbi:hypothetical protein CARUB_v10002894mg [Capsella rubella]|uniref:Uncharacterized protein n=1 Tax=Capsella rubella TaxID=81985 RepID=R0FJK8_9BRAS|nr:uncharacterized protein LOC17883418 [Capsella rubella]EOA22291.1 hypothetical protein CARUB_v10002894mg [Capsella rubella]
MQRLQISSRPSEEFLINLSPDFASPEGVVVYDVPKKELSPVSTNGERAIHIIPLVLFLCAFLLWVFSSTTV